MAPRQGDDPIATLMEEHQAYLRRLTAFRQDLVGGTARTVGAESLAGSALAFASFFVTEVEGLHARKEEQVFFPALRPHLPSPGPLDVMLADHRAVRDEVGILRTEGERLRGDPGAPGPTAEVRSAGARIVTILGDHIAKEDHVLFPMARDLLSRHEMDAIRAACMEIEAESGARRP